MRRLVTVTMMLAFALIIMLPGQVYAYNGGYLQGKAAAAATSPAFDTAGTITTLTDSNLSSGQGSSFVGYYTWTLDEPIIAKSYFMRHSGSAYTIRLYDADKTLLHTQATSTAAINGTFNFTAEVSGVKYVSVQRTSGVKTLYEVDIYGTAMDGSTPTPAPTATPTATPVPTATPTPTPTPTPKPSPTPTPIPALGVTVLPNKDSLIVQISGGQAPYTIDWESGSSTTSGKQYKITGLEQSTYYTVTVSDSSGKEWTGKVNTGTSTAYVPPEIPNPSQVFQKMLDVFGTAAIIGLAIIGAAVALGLLIVLAMWGWRLLKKWFRKI